MNTTLIAHVATELVFFTGLTVFFNRKINAQDALIHELKHQLDEANKKIDVLSNKFNSLGKAMDNVIFELENRPSFAPQSQLRRRRVPSNFEDDEMPPQQSAPHQSAPQQSAPQHQSAPQSPQQPTPQPQQSSPQSQQMPQQRRMPPQGMMQGMMPPQGMMQGMMPPQGMRMFSAENGPLPMPVAAMMAFMQPERGMQESKPQIEVEDEDTDVSAELETMSSPIENQN